MSFDALAFDDTDRRELQYQVERAYRKLPAAEADALISDAKAIGKGADVIDITKRLPEVDLAEWLECEPPLRQSLWGELLPCRQTTMLTGRGGIGKSLLALNLCCSTALGRPFLGVETVRSKCLIVNCEDDGDEMHRRVRDYCQAEGLELGSLIGQLHVVSLVGEAETALAVFDHSTGRLQPTERWDQLLGTVERHGIRLVVFDNATDAMAGDLNDLHQVAAFVNLLTGLALRMDGAVIILHHPNKAGADWLGSMAWHNKVRSRLFIKDSGIEGDSDGRIIENPKLNYGPMGGQICFRWHDGAFVNDEALPANQRATLAETARASGDNQVFLDCLALLASQERAVSAATSPSYAPKVMAELPQSKGIGKARLAAAMNRLLSIGRIERGELPWRKADRKQAIGLRESAANGAANGAVHTCGERGEHPSQPAEMRAAHAAETYAPPKGGEGAAPEGPAAPSFDPDGDDLPEGW